MTLKVSCISFSCLFYIKRPGEALIGFDSVEAHMYSKDLEMHLNSRIKSNICIQSNFKILAFRFDKRKNIGCNIFVYFSFIFLNF